MLKQAKHLASFSKWKSFLLISAFFASCNILGPDPETPKVIHPLQVEAGQNFTIEISNHKEFYFPYCGGLIYSFEKQVNGDWILAGGSTGFCAGPTTIYKKTSDSLKIETAVEESGTYRFQTAFSYKENGKTKKLKSGTFKVNEP